MPATRSKGRRTRGAGFGVVEEGVAGRGLPLDVVDYPCLFECAVEPGAR
jgi:hypothetical protein